LYRFFKRRFFFWRRFFRQSGAGAHERDYAEGNSGLFAGSSGTRRDKAAWQIPLPLSPAKAGAQL
jgi:hypothetical protein